MRQLRLGWNVNRGERLAASWPSRRRPVGAPLRKPSTRVDLAGEQLAHLVLSAPSDPPADPGRLGVGDHEHGFRAWQIDGSKQHKYRKSRGSMFTAWPIKLHCLMLAIAARPRH